MSIILPRGVLITAESFEDEEVMYPVMRCYEAGITLDVATKGAKLVNGRLGFPLELIVRYYSRLVDATKLDIVQYDFVLLPGGFEAPDRVRQIPEVLSFVSAMHKGGRIVAAFCHGPWILISAGLTKGKNITGYVGIKDDIVNSGAQYIDKAVVVDGNIITSRHPRDIGEFMKTLLTHLHV
jgi:protease I